MSNRVPVLSAEVFTVPVAAGQYLVYAPLRKAAFVANASVVNFLADLQDAILAAEADPDGAIVEFLRRLEIVDGGLEARPITVFEGAPEATSVTLFLTTACNLRCTYCYASAGDTPAKSMPLDVAKRGIEFVAQNAVRQGAATFDINYHGGGEPSANWHVMTESWAYAHARAGALGLAAPHASAATNGVLRDDQIDWMITHLDGGASVSFDGLPAVHDRHRLTVLGKGSSAQVIRTLKRFDAAGFPYGVRLTVTADQIAQLADSVDFVCSQFRTKRIQVEPAYQLGRWRDAPSAETDAFIAAYRLAQKRAAHHGREICFSAARVDVLSNHFCGVTQDTFALSPDGNVSACYEVFSEDQKWAPMFFYGKPGATARSYDFDMTKLNHLRGQSVQNRAYCNGCFAKWTCAGDCYHKSIDVTGNVEFQGTDRCHITRELTKDQILARIASAGGVFWHEPPDEQVGPTRGKEALL